MTGEIFLYLVIYALGLFFNAFMALLYFIPFHLFLLSWFYWPLSWFCTLIEKYISRY
jgi:hypothetical protein